MQACTWTALLKEVCKLQQLLSDRAGIYGGFKPKKFPAVVGLEGEQAPVSSVQHHAATGSSTVTWQAWPVTRQPASLPALLPTLQQVPPVLSPHCTVATYCVMQAWALLRR